MLHAIRALCRAACGLLTDNVRARWNPWRKMSMRGGIFKNHMFLFAIWAKTQAFLFEGGKYEMMVQSVAENMKILCSLAYTCTSTKNIKQLLV